MLGIVSVMTWRHPGLLLIAFVLGCTSAAEWKERADDAIARGDIEEAQDTLQKALEAHPDDLELLLTAAEMYLRPIPEEHYKPRLALHYALRADRAALHQDKRAVQLLTRSYRAAGGHPIGDTIVQRGLEQVGHRDAMAPKRLGVVDPDLLEPTAENLREQARRDAARKAGTSPCPVTLVHVPAGAYPVTDGEQAVAAFCVTPAGRSEEGCPDARTCTEPERKVACTALGAVLGHDPSCVDAAQPRCCADPSVAGAQPDP